MSSFNWLCPYCNHHVLITDELHSSGFHKLGIDSAEDPIGISTEFLVCPNAKCRKATLKAELRVWLRLPNGQTRFSGPPRRSWRLMPEGDARPFPDFVPKAIRDDYREACLIRDLSPKASATLSRRTLQGILRDYFNAKQSRLAEQINSLQESMEDELWLAIDGVRKVGNIGAHMEANIDVIVEVDPDEAQLLIELVETLLEETYVRRDARQKRLKAVADLAAEKEEARKPASAPAPKPPKSG